MKYYSNELLQENQTYQESKAVENYKMPENIRDLFSNKSNYIPEYFFKYKPKPDQYRQIMISFQGQCFKDHDDASLIYSTPSLKRQNRSDNKGIETLKLNLLDNFDREAKSYPRQSQSDQDLLSSRISKQSPRTVIKPKEVKLIDHSNSDSIENESGWC